MPKPDEYVTVKYVGKRRHINQSWHRLRFGWSAANDFIQKIPSKLFEQLAIHSPGQFQAVAEEVKVEKPKAVKKEKKKKVKKVEPKVEEVKEDEPSATSESVLPGLG
jgi:hypothetical protein